MGMRIDDLTGLNSELVASMPVVFDISAAKAAASDDQAGPMSVAGMRHCQGGHTVSPGGRTALTTASMNRIGTPRAVANQPWAALVEVEAGATWGELHQVLGPFGYAPMIQQSSADFSIGGSLSVNCHSRDPRWGPLVDSVEDITVLTGIKDQATGDLITVTASRSQNDDLFKAALGGYGACGFILSVTLRVVENRMLRYVGDACARTLDEYVAHAQTLLAQTGGPVQLHYAWFNCVRGSLYANALVTDFIDEGGPVPQTDGYAEEPWGQDEFLRAGWSAARKSPRFFRGIVWNELLERHTTPSETGKDHVATRINWLRSAVSFTGYRGHTDTEVLQEYFVPVSRAAELMLMLRKLFRQSKAVNVLSTTLRVVRADKSTVLSYCPENRMCVAVDMAVPTVVSNGQNFIHPEALACLSDAIEAALACGGSFYLPYYKVATVEQFARAYPNHGTLRTAMNKYNPLQDGRRRFWNNFLARYLG